MSAAVLTAAALLAALHGPPAARARVLRPLLAREAAAHGLPAGLLRRVTFRESGWRYWARGDHGRALGLGQLHADCIPGRTLTARERVDVGTGVHWAAVRLVIARRRCGGGPSRFAANYSGRPCGAPVYTETLR